MDSVPRARVLFLLVVVPLVAAGPAPATSRPRAGARVRVPPAPVQLLGFDKAPLDVAWPDDTTWGGWYSLHDGFGRTTVVAEGTQRWLQLSTRRADSPTETYSSLVRTTRTFGDADFTVRVRTVEQLRAQPNPWEVGWVLWRYTDNDHFYSFIVKPDGWELAKEDQAYPGKQRFLAYSYARAFDPGRTYEIRVRTVGNQISIWVNRQRLVSYTDRQRPYRKGSIALYTEDSTALYAPVAVRAPSR